MTRSTIRRATLEEIERHAAAAYPEECCGVVLADGDGEHVRPIRNVQNEMHARDPETYPRTAAIAYLMDSQELFAVHREAERRNARIGFFYHSHPDHDAYFSEEDRAQAMAWDEPAYPEAVYVVLSVRQGAVVDRIAVAWDAERAAFAPVALDVV